MSIIGFFTEALAEGALFVLLKKIWDGAKKMYTTLGLSSPIQEAIKQRLVDGKSWEDENFFAKDLAECGLSSYQKEMLLDAMLDLAYFDARKGTHFARSFRLLVTFKDKDDVEPGKVRAGITILREIGMRCSNKAQVILYIIAVGGAVDSSTSLEKFQRLMKESVLPFLCENVAGFKALIEQMLKDASDTTRDYDEEFRNRPWWKKLFRS
ncbi:MAG: hypothetical protein HGB08_00295 [Candidatus Moranbacteria bacterium]|nr:hypothetical protein [Candidatus Moranbacteria bacterium]